MKNPYLLSLLLVLMLFLGAAPIAQAVGPLNALNVTDATDPPPFDLAAGEPIEPQDEPFGASSVLQSSASDWQIECVDCPKQFDNMTDRSLRLDTSDHPHIVYGGDHLYYAWFDGTEWHYETVDEATKVGEYASLVLDGTDRPHISYYDSVNHDLKYAWYDGTNWQIETVDYEGDVGTYTSLALDELDQPHISYYDDINDDLKYARHDGAKWPITLWPFWREQSLSVRSTTQHGSLCSR